MAMDNNVLECLIFESIKDICNEIENLMSVPFLRITRVTATIVSILSHMQHLQFSVKYVLKSKEIKQN